MNKIILNQNPFVATIDNVIPTELIKEMLAENDYVDSLGFVHDDKLLSSVSHRTSMTCYDLNNKYQEVTRIVVDCLKKEFNFIHTADTCETWQFTQYAPGQFYKPHWDFFNINDIRYTQSTTNDRIATVILYLNDNFEGGHTNFSNLNISVKPKSGKLLYFNYPAIHIDNQARELTLHEGAPVESGVKRIATLWIRETVYTL
jgi:prolyl 4-hydroxylase